MPYARWHHERFDGTGYPDRRGGHEVPLGVALVGVCDCWDALTEPRPYRTTYSYEGAVDEMQKGAGRQWSRVLVDWLLETVAAQSRWSRNADGSEGAYAPVGFIFSSIAPFARCTRLIA